MNVSHRVMKVHFQRVFEQSDLSPSQMQLLSIIEHYEPISLKILAAHMRMTPGAITQLIDGLDTAGYIERRQDPTDRRVTHIMTSKAAKAQLAELKKLREQILKKALASLDEHELKTFLKIQQKMLAYFEKENEQHKPDKKENA